MVCYLFGDLVRKLLGVNAGKLKLIDLGLAFVRTALENGVSAPVLIEVAAWAHSFEVRPWIPFRPELKLMETAMHAQAAPAAIESFPISTDAHLIPGVVFVF